MILSPVDLLEQGDAAAVRSRIDMLLAAGARSLLILAGEETELPQDEWDALLKALPVPVFGGVFPRIVLGRKTFSAGVLVMGLSCGADVCIIEGLDDDSSQPFAQDASHCARLRQAGTVMIWVDGLAQRISTLMEAVFDTLGAHPCYIGGGAGSLGFGKRPCLFSNRGVLRDAAVVVGLPFRMALGVAHGWSPLAGPFIVSEAQGNAIRSLDFRPAAQVYREVVEALAGVPLTEENFFSVAKDYPFGLERFDGTFVVRDPVIMDGDSLVCVGEVPALACLHVLQGDESALIHAARTGSAQAVGQLGQEGASVALLIDCVSGALFLRESHDEELAAVEDELILGGHGELPLMGVLSLGQIANAGDYSLELFNKTFVLGLMPDAIC